MTGQPGLSPVESGASGGGATAVNLTQVNGTAVSAANPVPESPIVAGAVVSSTNPMPVTGAVQPLVTTLDWRAADTLATGALTDTIQGAPGALRYNTLTDLTLSADALTAASTVSIKDGAAGTVLWQCRIQTTGLIATKFVFETPITASANTLLQIATTDPGVSGTIYWAAGGSVVG